MPHRKPFPLLPTMAAFVALLAPCVAPAQSEVDEQQQLLAQIQTDRRAIVLKTMALDEAQIAAFTPIYDAYQADRKKLADRAVELLNLYASNYESMTDDAAKGILKDWFELQDDQNGLMKNYAKRLARVLPQTKVLRFVQIENKIDAVLRLPAVRGVPLVQ
jgi:hypothetical protein